MARQFPDALFFDIYTTALLLLLDVQSLPSGLILRPFPNTIPTSPRSSKAKMLVLHRYLSPGPRTDQLQQELLPLDGTPGRRRSLCRRSWPPYRPSRRVRNHRAHHSQRHAQPSRRLERYPRRQRNRTLYPLPLPPFHSPLPLSLHLF